MGEGSRRVGAHRAILSAGRWRDERRTTEDRGRSKGVNSATVPWTPRACNACKRGGDRLCRYELGAARGIRRARNQGIRLDAGAESDDPDIRQDTVKALREEKQRKHDVAESHPSGRRAPHFR